MSAVTIAIVYDEGIEFIDVDVVDGDANLTEKINEAVVVWATADPEAYKQWIIDGPGGIEHADFDELLFAIPKEYTSRAGFTVIGVRRSEYHRTEHNHRRPIYGATYRKLYDLGVL